MSHNPLQHVFSHHRSVQSIFYKVYFTKS